MSKYLTNESKYYKTLLCPKEEGRLNLPKMRNYYWGANLRGLIMLIITLGEGFDQMEAKDK